jgi:hypothetical protein
MTQEQFDTWFAPLPRYLYELIKDGRVINMVSIANKLTRRILLQQDDWDDWKESEFTQLDQYVKQHMFGEPCPIKKKSAVFNLIWTYVVKELDGRKMLDAHMTDLRGSTQADQVRVLGHTFANSIDQTGSHIFYAVAATENLLIYGADVSNAFGEAPPPKQGFYIRPDQAFTEWFLARYGKEIPEGWVVPEQNRTEQLKKLCIDYFLPRRLNHNRESSCAEGTCQIALQPEPPERVALSLSHLSLRSGNKVARL